MKMKYILLFTMLPLMISAQHNAEFKNALRVSSSYSGYTGLTLNVGYEYFFTPKHSVIASGFSSRFSTGFTLGYRYNLLNFNRFEMGAGIDFRNEIFYKSDLGINNNLAQSFEPALEIKYNINIIISLFGGANSTFYTSKSRREDFLLGRLSLGGVLKF